MDEFYYQKSSIELAPLLLGCCISHFLSDGTICSGVISETEAYYGENDTACYAYKGRNKTSELLYHAGGTIFVHRCYGIHWLLNIVSGKEDDAQGVLIRGIDDVHGPGRVTKYLSLSNEYNGQLITECPSLIIYDRLEPNINYQTLPRIGISYASTEDQALPLRFVLQ